MDYELGVIGAGNMAEAIVRGVVSRGLLSPRQIIAAAPSPRRRELFQTQLGVHVVEDNVLAAESSRIVLLSVKPQQMRSALSRIGDVADPAFTLIVSIAAGISTAYIEEHLAGSDPTKQWRV